MDFTVSKAEFLRELSFTQGVVERKTTIPILANLLIEASEDQVRITATDLELGIHCSFPAKVETPGAGTIPAKRLLDYVRLLPDADMRLKFLENQWASITCGRSRTRIAGMPKDSFPELPATENTSIAVPALRLKTMISQTVFAISNEETRFTLNGALLVLEPNAMKMVATDGHRLAHVMTDAPIEGITEPVTALLPRKAMAELVKLMDTLEDEATIDFAQDENHLFFRTESRLLVTRRLSGTFPDYERVLPKEQTSEIVLAKDDLRASLERVQQFSDERSRAVKLALQEGQLKIYSSITDTGDSEELLPAEYHGALVDIGFNAQYLLEFLRAVSGTEIRFCFRDSQSAAEFQPAEEGSAFLYRYVVMPMRV
jgi:DNA polymerase III subunit beta